MRLRSFLERLQRLLSIPGGGVDAGQVGEVIDVVELQLDGAFAEVDGRFDPFLDQRQAETKVRKAGGRLRGEHRRGRILAAVDVEKQRQRAEVLLVLRQ